MVPLIPMVVIPLGEVFIPLYVKLGMMPSVFGKKTTTVSTLLIVVHRNLQ